MLHRNAVSVRLPDGTLGSPDMYRTPVIFAYAHLSLSGSRPRFRTTCHFNGPGSPLGQIPRTIGAELRSSSEKLGIGSLFDPIPRSFFCLFMREI
jgi:hypothetical protein